MMQFNKILTSNKWNMRMFVVLVLIVRLNDFWSCYSSCTMYNNIQLNSIHSKIKISLFVIERNEWKRTKISTILLDTVRMLMCIAMYADIIASINLNMFLISLIMMFLHMNKNKEILWWFCSSLTLIFIGFILPWNETKEM